MNYTITKVSENKINFKGDSIEDKYISLAIELANKSPGSLIIKDKGSLYLGGMSIWEKEFLETNKISHIINTAGGLDKMFPTWARNVKEHQKNFNIKVLNLGWSDTIDQLLWNEKPWDQLIESIMFIHDCLSKNENVAVHCAQGKSRSSTVVCAYIMVYNDVSAEDALKFVQTKRSLAEPNSSFMSQLKEFSKSKEISDLKSKFSK